MNPTLPTLVIPVTFLLFFLCGCREILVLVGFIPFHNEAISY